MGIVEQVGSKVSAIHTGDRVIASDITACGSCWYCRQGLHWNCASRSLFGYGPAFGESLAGGQSEYVRIPYADTVLIPVPSDLSDDKVLFLGDILSTGFLCASNGGVKPGDVVAVIGSGPVGVLTQMSAFIQGAAKVFAIDRLPERLAVAERFGSVPINFEKNDPRAIIESATKGRGADVALEAVGGKEPLDSALRVVRPHGTVSIVGVHLEDNYPFSAIDGFVRELTMRFGVGDPMRLASQILPLIENEVIQPERIISHRITLNDVPEGYRLFNDRQAFKILVEVS
jgi:threonine dehydrogenase-like Zn-dependent dehydrogenase